MGWRGFALLKLQARYNPLVASLVIALAWFPWHIPLRLLPGDEIYYLYYGLSFIPQSVFLTWIFNRTNGSILAVGIAHVSLNISVGFLFPSSYAGIILEFIMVTILILSDRMWEKSVPVDSSILESGTEH